MISKKLFFKLIKQDLKKRIWCPLILSIVYFLVLEVNMLRVIENITAFPNRYTYTISTYINDYFFGTYIAAIAIVVCFTAFVCAISGFSYLHSKVQLDIYHSLPVSRSQLFWSRYVSGILLFLIPFVVHVLICAGIVIARGEFYTNTIVAILNYVGVELIIFVLTYSVSVLAVILTGYIILSILGSIILFSYSFIIAVLVNALFDRFFHTFALYYASSAEYILTDGILGISPLAMIKRLFTDPNETIIADERFYKYNPDCIWVLVVAAIVYTVIAYIAYLKRASEAAGKAIAFSAAEPVIKTLIVIPAAFFSGIFFNLLLINNNPDGWFMFGLVFGYIIFACLIEIIFRMDIRGIWMHKKQFVFNAICTALMFIILKNDVLGYNTYVPADSQIQSCAVSIESLMPLEYIVDLPEYKGVYYVSANEYRMRTMEMQGNPSVMELARLAAKNGLRYTQYHYYDGIEQDPEYCATMEREQSYRGISFAYKLKDGKTVYRRYVIDIADTNTLKLLMNIFNDPSYKIGSIPLFGDGWDKEYNIVICTNNWDTSTTIELSAKQRSALLDAYQSEYMALTLRTVMDTCPIGTVRFLCDRNSTDTMYNSDTDTMLVYPQFEKTIALLKEYGFDMEATIHLDEVSGICVTKNENRAVAGQSSTETTIPEDLTIEYTDKEEIQQILNCILRGDLYWPIQNYTNFYDTRYDVYLKHEDYVSDLYKYYFKIGEIPEFIVSDE